MNLSGDYTNLVDGSWTGQRCFVIGGGPSLKDLDFSLLKDELWIGTNVCWRYNPPINAIADERYYDFVKTDSEWQAYGGITVTLNYTPRKGLDRFPGTLSFLTDSNWAHSFKSGRLYQCSDTGSLAIQIADILRPRVIYLLGFDMKGLKGLTANFHTEYPAQWAVNECAYDRFVKSIERIKGEIKTPIYNLGMDSRLDIFPKRSWSRVPWWVPASDNSIVVWAGEEADFSEKIRWG